LRRIGDRRYKAAVFGARQTGGLDFNALWLRRGGRRLPWNGIRLI
jgi:hypothetical protein